jgi:hypothetical protein
MTRSGNGIVELAAGCLRPFQYICDVCAFFMEGLNA